nr:hypothetical protein [Tanacetum cinerariifolium]
MGKASDLDLPQTLSRHIGIRRLTIGLILSMFLEPFKMVKTGQRARSSAGRDPNHLLSSKISKWRAPRLKSTLSSSRPSSTAILMAANLRRTRCEFNMDAISINETRGTFTDVDVDEVKEDNKRLRKELHMLRTGQRELWGRDDESGVDEDTRRDEEIYDMLYMGKTIHEPTVLLTKNSMGPVMSPWKIAKVSIPFETSPAWSCRRRVIDEGTKMSSRIATNVVVFLVT